MGETGAGTAVTVVVLIVVVVVIVAIVAVDVVDVSVSVECELRSRAPSHPVQHLQQGASHRRVVELAGEEVRGGVEQQRQVLQRQILWVPTAARSVWTKRVKKKINKL